ncbi:hypothetical protein E3E11_06265 [Oecophyllibacter saccharovorans]|uniref:capsular polysaccharide export protein, LipB/KpsS family n=1 Tax=Oecophyllibacter saccharovorans TaxID=2558360 RepID=UPI0011445C30|nr:hypothetical protein [Oecophyllibacter saccharovorans]QDH15515.1 hypothetical protein E3E11_06265 [Oecophyllibacter saccharovorans]
MSIKPLLRLPETRPLAEGSGPGEDLTPHPPVSHGSGSHEPVSLARIWQAGVGGAFWAPEPGGESPLPPIVVSLGEDPEGACALSMQVLQLLGRTGVEAAEVGVVFPEPGPFGHVGLREAASWRGLAQALRRAGVRCFVAPCAPQPLLQAARLVLAGSAEDPFALLGKGAGLPVWVLQEEGLAELELEAAERINGAFRYRHPVSGAPVPPGEMLGYLRHYRALLQANRRIGACYGMAWWKRRRMRAFLFQGAGEAPPFHFSGRRALEAARRRGGALAVWAAKVTPGLEARALSLGVPLLRIEDGFIRSLGLGSGFLPPCSIVCDGRGNYFDPSRPSTLEHILATADFTPELRGRAARLVERLKREKVSKYGAGSQSSQGEAGDRFTVDRARAAGKPVLLVPGQVADDLSVRLGSGEVRDNLALLKAVRAQHPEAWIVYRPHPDVEAGHRHGALADSEVLQHADQIARGGTLVELLEQVDAVHTLTSLGGFEALLRGLPVTTWGTPFYAGWGLTTDRAPIPPGRGRALTLLDLAAATLLLYPRYLDPRTELPCTPEVLLDRLGEPDLWQPGLAMRLRKVQGQVSRWLGRRKVRLGRRKRPGETREGGTRAPEFCYHEGRVPEGGRDRARPQARGPQEGEGA